MTRRELGAWLINQIDHPADVETDNKGRLVFKLPETTCVYKVFPENIERFRAKVVKSIAFKNVRGNPLYLGGKLC
jgi:hypothetical protein